MHFASYGWIIDIDRVSCDGPELDVLSRVGTIGPLNIRPVIHARLLARDIAPDVKRWRCLDDDGEVYYEGRYIGSGEADGFGPLEDFARPDAGATTIEYLNPANGQWEAL